MSVFELFIDFIKAIFMPLTDEEILGEDETEAEVCEEQQEEETMPKKVKKPSLLMRLYSLEQEIVILEKEFPEAYQTFGTKIAGLKQQCYASLEGTNKELTFDIDPDTDSEKIGEVSKLEKAVREFIETEVKFKILSERLQKLITRLSILYNVSISHAKSEEKQKVLSQLKHAAESERMISQELKQSDYILKNKQMKQRLTELMTYTDYLIFKIGLRNSSSNTPSEHLEKLLILEEAYEVDYVEAFKSFVKDELYDLGELLSQVQSEQIRKVLRKQAGNILVELTYSENVEDKLWNPAFWNSFMTFEESLIGILASNDESKEMAQVKIIARMNITVKKDDVLMPPAVSSYMALTTIFLQVQDVRVLLLMKLLQNMSKEVTYKEIYFLTVLFGAKDIIQSVPNNLVGHIQKYQEKYPYDAEAMRKKNNSVMEMANKEYVAVFTLDDYAQSLVEGLKNLNIDFKVVADKVLMNSFYFSGLSNVVNSLQAIA